MSNDNNSLKKLKFKKDLIPSEGDRNNIDKFLSNHKGKKVVVVQGLGFVGSVMSLVCANAINEEYAVIGVDLPSNRKIIDKLNSGIFPIKSSDKKVDEYFQNSIKKNNFFATCDSYAYSKADIIIIDINLDVDKISTEKKELLSYDVDLNNFKSAIKVIASNCNEDILILVETTVPPGTCEKIIKPIIKDEFNRRNLDYEKIYIAHSYERVMPGPNYIDSIQNFYRVYSGVNEKSADYAEKFLKTIISTEKFPLTRLQGTNATEMAKVLENSFRAMNIAFIVEWSRFAEEAKVNLYEVINAIRMRPTHKNIMLPGIGVGGYCLTKDPLLASWSKLNLFESNTGLDQSEKGVKINDQMPLFAYNYLMSFFKRDFKNLKILLLGVSYLSNVGDTRYSPVELFYNCLEEAGAIINLHDPYVSFWTEKNITIENNLDNLLCENYDIIVISTGHSFYSGNEILMNYIMNNDNIFIFDTIGLLSEKEIKKISSKHQLKILGRGVI